MLDLTVGSEPGIVCATASIVMTRQLKALAVTALIGATAVPASAHHEAIYGAQSALTLSGDRYVTTQVFTRRTGPKNERVQETTTVLSAGFSPRRGPFSVSIVVPFSVIGAGGSRLQTGLENAVFAGRYRLDLPGVARIMNVEESYVLGVGGVEVPTGTIDYDFLDGAPAVVGAGVVGVERRPFSLIGYGVVHRYAERHGVRDSGNTYFGGGLAWTPIDEPQAGRLFSLQFGVSREAITREVVNGIPQSGTGGWAFVAHPTVAWTTSEQLLFFVSTAVPLAAEWPDPADRERYRIGTGIIVSFGN